jgi:phosphoribosylformylglycinamidine synthase
VVLLGEPGEEIAASAWLALRRGLEAGRPPQVDLAHEGRLIDLLVRAVAEGALRSAHDVSDGGLALALAECCIAGPLRRGATIRLEEGARPDALLFGESPGRVIATSAAAEGLLVLADELRVPARRLGRTGGDRLVVGPHGADPWIDCPLDELHERWARAIPRRLSE